ncbi:MAG: hypothetical protein HGB11_01445 [Chlorobiales bacterium]|nr:hypothetical protein [Chlorobiales bacterium]
MLLYPQERPEKIWEEIRSSITENLIANEERGKEATGLAVVQTTGRISIAKMPVPASDFVKTDQYSAVLSEIGPQTTAVLGHTRKPTKGTAFCCDNNHPIYTETVVGIHNGHIENDNEIFGNSGSVRRGEVDSEIIFRLLDTVSHEKNDDQSLLCEIQQKLTGLKGKLTFISCDSRQPERLLLVRHLNPLSHYYHPDWQSLIFSSRYIFLRKAFGLKVASQALKNDHAFLFNAYQLPQIGSDPVASAALHFTHDGCLTCSFSGQNQTNICKSCTDKNPAKQVTGE